MKRLVILVTTAAALHAAAATDRPSSSSNGPPERVTDQGRLYEGTAIEIASPTETGQVQALVRRAARNHWKVSIAGKRHSQGGQSFGDSTLQIDLLRYRRVLRLDTLRRAITVQSGATWRDVQEAANPHRLAPRVMQNSNIFTIGGSMSVNAHGPDPREGTVLTSVRGFRLLGPDGTIRHVDREHDPELLRLVIGGYGLFGVILDVDLELTRNAVYRRRTRTMKTSEYPSWFAREVRGRDDVGIHYAWLSIAPGSLLGEVYAMSYVEVEPPRDSVAVFVRRRDDATRFLFGLSRRWDWGKNLRWTLQKWLGQPGVPEVCTRNDILSPNIDFLEHADPSTTDVLQEYFVPAAKLAPFLEGMREVCRSRHVNLLSATIRFLPDSERPYLSYQPAGDAFAVVIYVNVRRDEPGRRAAAGWTRELVDLALRSGGTYYLVYQRWPTADQLRAAYPAFEGFIARKRAHDPGEMFSSAFYRHYAPPAPLVESLNPLATHRSRSDE